MPATARMLKMGARVCAADGKSGRQKRRKAYAPVFDIAPASIAVTGAGASLYASGSQLWNGINGTLTAKAAASARNSQICTLLPMAQLCPLASVGLRRAAKSRV